MIYENLMFIDQKSKYGKNMNHKSFHLIMVIFFLFSINIYSQNEVFTSDVETEKKPWIIQKI